MIFLDFEMDKVTSGSCIQRFSSMKKMFDLHFKTLNCKKKSMTQTVSSFALTCKRYLRYLKAKLQQDSFRWCSYTLKCHKTAGITYLQANKQQTRYRLAYLDVSKLEQGFG